MANEKLTDLHLEVLLFPNAVEYNVKIEKTTINEKDKTKREYQRKMQKLRTKGSKRKRGENDEPR